MGSKPRTLGEYLQTVRERTGLSQRQVAAKAGVHHSYLARLENGEVATRPDVELLQRLANALEVDVRDLLAFLGVTPAVPAPRIYFRQAYGLTARQAAEAERQITEIIEGLRTKPTPH